jgi:hypothetical protein
MPLPGPLYRYELCGYLTLGELTAGAEAGQGAAVWRAPRSGHRPLSGVAPEVPRLSRDSHNHLCCPEDAVA